MNARYRINGGSLQKSCRLRENYHSLIGLGVEISYALVIDFEISDIRPELARIQRERLNTRGCEMRWRKGGFQFAERDRFPRIFLTFEHGRSDTSACIIVPKSSRRTSRMSPERSATDKKFVDAIAPRRQRPFSRPLSAFARTYGTRRTRRKSRENFALWCVRGN